MIGIKPLYFHGLCGRLSTKPLRKNVEVGSAWTMSNNEIMASLPFRVIEGTRHLCVYDNHSTNFSHSQTSKMRNSINKCYARSLKTCNAVGSSREDDFSFQNRNRQSVSNFRKDFKEQNILRREKDPDSGYSEKTYLSNARDSEGSFSQEPQRRHVIRDLDENPYEVYQEDMPHLLSSPGKHKFQPQNSKQDDSESSSKFDIPWLKDDRGDDSHSAEDLFNGKEIFDEDCEGFPDSGVDTDFENDKDISEEKIETKKVLSFEGMPVMQLHELRTSDWWEQKLALPWDDDPLVSLDPIESEQREKEQRALLLKEKRLEEAKLLDSDAELRTTKIGEIVARICESSDSGAIRSILEKNKIWFKNNDAEQAISLLLERNSADQAFSLWEWMKEREWYQPSAEVHMKLISHLSSPLSKASQCTRVYDSLLVHDLKASSGTFTQVVMRLIEEEELILAWRVCQDMEAFGGFAIPISILHLLLEELNNGVYNTQYAFVSECVLNTLSRLGDVELFESYVSLSHQAVIYGDVFRVKSISLSAKTSTKLEKQELIAQLMMSCGSATEKEYCLLQSDAWNGTFFGGPTHVHVISKQCSEEVLKEWKQKVMDVLVEAMKQYMDCEGQSRKNLYLACIKTAMWAGNLDMAELLKGEMAKNGFLCEETTWIIRNLSAFNFNEQSSLSAEGLKEQEDDDKFEASTLDGQKLLKDEREILVGLMLAGAFAETKSENQSTEIHLTVSAYEPHRTEFLSHLYFELASWIRKPPMTRANKFPVSGVCEFFVHLTIGPHPAFTIFRSVFFSRNFLLTPTIPRVLADWLTPQVFAYWYMCAGARDEDVAAGITFEFPKCDDAQCDQLLSALLKFGTEIEIEKCEAGNRVKMMGGSASRVWSSMQPFLLPSFL